MENFTTKFRAWCHTKGEFVDPIYNNTSLSDLFELPFYILQQYSGVKDKDMDNVYVGDYVETGNGRIFEIRVGEYTYLNESKCYGFYMHSKYGNIPLNNHIEVVGNIFENPEFENK